jgi:hypothetical protein
MFGQPFEVRPSGCAVQGVLIFFFTCLDSLVLVKDGEVGFSLAFPRFFFLSWSMAAQVASFIVSRV